MADVRIIRILKTSRLLEIYVWVFISLLVGGRPFYWGVVLGKYKYTEFFLDFYTEILFAILVLLFPFLFKLIFAELPFEYIRNRRREKLYSQVKKIRKDLVDDESLSDEGTLKEEVINEESLNEGQKLQETIIVTNTTKDKEEVSLEVFLSKSRQIADRLYSRAGAYLLIGCLIAFAGVLFFYFQTTTLHNALAPIIKDLNTSRILFEYLPRVGTLIFVEAIAFFFLKQYRVTMEEYRYYEAIKRQRENQLAILEIFNDYKDKPELFEKLVQSLSFSDNPNKLAGGDTTTIIETEKLNAKEGDLLEKLLEFLKLYKK